MLSSPRPAMYLDDPDLEQRLSRFEAQLDRFSLALHQWQETSGRHADNPSDIEQRLRNLEETVSRETRALRQLHEEPLKQLQAQAAGLTDIFAAATTSVQRLDDAEARLREFQANVQLLLTDVSRTLQAIVADMRGRTTSAVGSPRQTASWPLERVVHLHDELRQSASGNGTASSRDAASSETLDAEPAELTPDAMESAAGRVYATERPAIRSHAMSSPPPETPERHRRFKYVAGILAVAAILLVAAVVRGVEGRLNDAAARVAAAERQVSSTTQLANREVAAARQNADKQIIEARQVAQRAETVGAILTAPDLIRFNLTSADGDRSSAQVLWSRTRGLVLSGSRLPAAPPQTTYQLWLMTSEQPVSAGVFVPDPDGRATLVVDTPPRIGPVIGAEVTVEANDGGKVPSGRTLLTRLPRAALGS